jgi:Short C-terminal domain/Protein of unknown function (DUF2510)
MSNRRRIDKRRRRAVAGREGTMGNDFDCSHNNCGEPRVASAEHCQAHLTPEDRHRIAERVAGAQAKIESKKQPGFPTPVSPAGWYAHPTEPGAWQYWDGRHVSELVHRDGKTTIDAGWKPDYDGSQNLRYWDGRTWTHHVHPIATPTPPQQSRMARWAEKAQSQVMFNHATYLGGLPQARLKKTGALYFTPDVTGIGTLKPRALTIPTRLIASVEVVGGEVAKRKVAAVAAFGVLGGLAAKGAKNQTVVIVRLTDGAEAYFELDRIAPQEVRAKLAPWLGQNGIPWRDDEPAAAPAAAPIASIADELQKLAALRDSGVLTPDEFAAAKARLLAGGSAHES